MRKKKLFLSLVMAWLLILAACSQESTVGNDAQVETTEETEADDTESIDTVQEDTELQQEQSFSLADIPEYTSSPYVVVNNNTPYFTEEDYSTEVFEIYSDLDGLGRCGVAYANICKELMPTEDRESISDIKPSGWNNKEYNSSLVDGRFIYNRCHLIGFQLAGENANELNLITGTRYMNVQGMLPFENMVADYVKETDNHVLYRVTPVFEGNNLVASGVLMEGWSVEDDGDGICFNVYVYNVQPGIEIDYATGDNWEASSEAVSDSNSESAENTEYVLNTNSMKFHKPNCSSVEDISESNREDYSGSREELIAEGYSPCGRCNP